MSESAATRTTSRTVAQAHGREWKLPPALEPYRHLIHVEHGRTVEQAVNDAPVTADIEDALSRDRQRVLAQVKILRRQYNGGWLRPAGATPEQGDAP